MKYFLGREEISSEELNDILSDVLLKNNNEINYHLIAKELGKKLLKTDFLTETEWKLYKMTRCCEEKYYNYSVVLYKIENNCMYFNLYKEQQK